MISFVSERVKKHESYVWQHLSRTRHMCVCVCGKKGRAFNGEKNEVDLDMAVGFIGLLRRMRREIRFARKARRCVSEIIASLCECRL